MAAHQSIRFTLHISYDDYAKVYQGVAKTITVIADDGRSIMFPAGNIQSYLTRDGIHGYCEMTLTRENKFVAIQKIR
jgi:hypothetical protein